MYCVKSQQTIEDHIKKSRFIGMIFPCRDEQTVVRHLKHLHEEYPDATHIVYAYRLKTPQGFVYRFHDAGEPSGTAGKPIFQHLEGKNLIDVLLVVIRYFGGIKLGAGGLTRAYGNAAKRVIDEAEVEPFIEMATVKLSVTYSQLQPLEYLLKKLYGHIVDQQFAERINLVLELPLEQVPTLQQSFPLLEKI
ncbi:MAG: YigZ family protein [Methylomicrobium sp.]